MALPKLDAQQTMAQSHVVQLSKPVVGIDSLLFKKQALISIGPSEVNSSFFYEEDGERLKFEDSLKVLASSRLRFWAENPAFKTSDTVSIDLIRVAETIEVFTLNLITQPHEDYSANGATSLLDLQKGTVNFRNENRWLGFNEKAVQLILEFSKPTKISTIKIGMLKDHSSWIFLPKSVTVKVAGSSHGYVTIPTPEGQEKPLSTFVDIAVVPKQYIILELDILNLEEIPAWHQGKGTTPWLFIDELLIIP